MLPTATLRALFSIALDLLGSVLGPPRCAACDDPTPRRIVFCPACTATIERRPRGGPEGPHFAAFVYGGAMARAITRFKYERRPDLGRPLADLLWGEFEPHARGPDLVVPVPLHPRRLAERGFNQSALLAARVAWQLDVPLAPRALRRVRDTPRQATLGRAARRANVEGAFEVRDARIVRGRTVLLVDDVRTTGATLRACAGALLESGASEVTPLALAQAD